VLPRLVRVALVLGLLATAVTRLDGQAEAPVLRIVAPPSLVGVAAQAEAVNRIALGEALARAGLPVPPRVEVTLLAEDDPRGRAIPQWVVGLAVGEGEITILPQRVGAYPYGSLESVVWHEVAHLALSIQTRGGAVPRWFHEGVATSVERDWGLTTGLRLGFALAAEPDLPALERLFASASQPETSRAYLLAAVVVSDLRRRHGADAPGAIAGLVADGVPFARAFEQYTGEPQGFVAARAWEPYRRWSNWVPVLTSGSAVWTLTLVLAGVAFGVTLRRRARRRRAWDEQDLLS
jgi:hypothetical protein